jgi:hypothetical protein
LRNNFDKKGLGNILATFSQTHLVTLLDDNGVQKRLYRLRSFPASVPKLTFTLHHEKARLLQTGLPDFSWYMIPKPEKMYQINTK